MKKFKYLIATAILAFSMCLQSLAVTATDSNASIMTTDELYLDTADLSTTNVYRSQVIYPYGYEHFILFRNSSSTEYYAAFFNGDSVTNTSINASNLITMKYTAYALNAGSDFDLAVEFLYAEDKSTYATYNGANVKTYADKIYATSYTVKTSDTILKEPCDWVDGANVYEETTPDTGEDTGDSGNTDNTTDTGYDDTNLLGKLKAWFENMVDSIIDMRDKIVNAINTMIGSVQSSITDLGNAIIERINTFITTVSDAITSVYNELVALPDKIAEMFLIDFSVVDAKINELKGNFKIINEVKELWEYFKSTLETQARTTPCTTITLPEEYGGGTYKMINLEPFEPYRETIKEMIGAFLLINYFYLVFKQIPSIIQGATSLTEQTTTPMQYGNDGYYTWVMPEQKGINKKTGWLLGNNLTYYIEDKKNRRK